ncbi:MAG: DUF4294 domain-containing protein [Flavobacteriales bacterium]|nr:DUF4294 domain-containing protein [Flavobacteriales bacterium]MCB9447942.1 DUF4294 domain-containing protein [Flavobacteriales bacterium]
MKRLFCISYLLLSALFSQAQTEGGYTVAARVENGDTLLYASLPQVTISEFRRFANDREYLRYKKLLRDVRRAYPYAKLAGEKMREYAALLEDVKKDSQKRKLMKQAEQELKDQFEGDIRKLTISQGRILIKLIDRETGDTSYDIIKDLRGGFSAFCWQSLARLFGSNLKDTYDAEGDDKMIEQIVQAIEAGEI